MPAYIFGQYPSDGRYRAPAVFVIVEAGSIDEANKAAPTAGVYFDGVELGIDPEDGTDRWWRLDNDETEYECVEVAIDMVEPVKRRRPEAVMQAGSAYVVVQGAS